MAQITFTTKACSNWIPATNRVSAKTLATFNEIEKEIKKNIKNRGPYLEQFLYEMRENLKRPDSATWLEENRKENRESVFLMPDLDLLSTDSKELRIEKLIIGAKLIEVIEA